MDNRFQKLIDICITPCRFDYFQRFLGRDSRYYKTENLWWIDCWESIRLNNILHELNIRPIHEYFQESDGKEFASKWPSFFRVASSERMGKNSLPTFAYLEGIRLLVNLNKPIPYEELKEYFKKLCEKEDNSLKIFPNSNEIRCRAISLIDLINDKAPEKYDFNYIKVKLLDTLKNLISKSYWNQFSHTWAPILLKISNDDIKNLIISKIPTPPTIDPRWVKGPNFTRKPRYAFLLLFRKLKSNIKYFDLIQPNRFAYVPGGHVDSYVYVSSVVDKVLQSFKDIKEIQKKIQENDIKEDFFRDLLKSALYAAKNGRIIEWVEKERETPSGRITDIWVTVNKEHEIPIEVKVLWRFKENYEPIDQVLDQISQGHFGIIIIINPPNSPCYKKKYQNFEGWVNYVRDHKTYIPGSIKYFDEYFESGRRIKTLHIFSDHRQKLKEKEHNVTLLSFFINLYDYKRSDALKKL